MKRGPKPKQATQDHYFEITKFIYRCRGAGYGKDAAVEKAREAYGLKKEGTVADVSSSCRRQGADKGRTRGGLGGPPLTRAPKP